MTDAPAIRRAIEKGVAYLESVQLPSGEIPIETSSNPEMIGHCVRDPSVFPAALAARALVTPAAANVRSRAVEFLAREMEPGGLWRYRLREELRAGYIPPDLDDTSVASAALAAAGKAPDNRPLLLANRGRNGLFRTWVVRWHDHPLRLFRFFHNRNATARMRDVDAVVNANIVAYLGLCDETRPAIEHLLAVLRTNREMDCDKWYEGRFAIWYFFSHALHAIAPEAGDMIVPRVEATAPVNALDLALASSTLLLWNRVPDIGPLIDAQLPSGAWPRAGLYHGGRNPQPTPPWFGSEALTTVFAVEALSRRMACSTRRGNSER
jgi:hypothetical protein